MDPTVIHLAPVACSAFALAAMVRLGMAKQCSSTGARTAAPHAGSSSADAVALDERS